MSSAREHAEWLSLIEISGPFLSLPVLGRIFPQGLPKPYDESEMLRDLRLAYAEWQDEIEKQQPDPAIHQAWVRFVLGRVLGLELPEPVLLEGQAVPPGLVAQVAEHGETLRPDLVLVNPQDRPDAGTPRLLVSIVAPEQTLEKPLEGAVWKASPAARMMELLHAADVRLGLLTNGEAWMLVDAPRNETTGYITWYAQVWLDELVTLRAFRALLGLERFFQAPDDETLEALLAESAGAQQEVTDQLGYQVRRAVELLVQALDRIDKDRNRTLLAGIDDQTIYGSALAVMMRLVLLLSAEERELLPLGVPLYDAAYAASTLRAQLQAAAYRDSEEVLERRHDAWSRLLATFRAIHGGIEYDELRLPAHGGDLFDPDRYPFLEGRPAGTSWRETPAQPIPINNRTVLHLLEALQLLQVRVQGGTEARLLSFRSLDVEQIGHVYEGLLDHTAKRASEPLLGLVGGKDREPEIPLATLEALAAKGSDTLIAFLKEETGRSENALRKVLTLQPTGLEPLVSVGPVQPVLPLQPLAPLPPVAALPALPALPEYGTRPTSSGIDAARLHAACDNDMSLYQRVLPFAGLLRQDTNGYPVVIAKDSVYVTKGTDRRATGTHYTPRSLTEPIVQYTLEPLVYVGPAEGTPREAWRLKQAADLLELKICDMAMGSGAFLVQACRYLAERLEEAWEQAERNNPGGARITPYGARSSGEPGEELVAERKEERRIQAMRVVADRCLYGVDKNPTAVEMAKLSLWLITMQANRPFTFLDHAFRCGDSLLGVRDLDQLRYWSLDLKQERQSVTYIHQIDHAVQEAFALRSRITAMADTTPGAIAEKAKLLARAEAAMAVVSLGADLLIGRALGGADHLANYSLIMQGHRHTQELQVAGGGRVAVGLSPQGREDVEAGRRALNEAATLLLGGRRPFHWPLEFPEVFVGDAAPSVDWNSVDGMLSARFGPARQGFDAIIGNPPFQGGQRITGALGTEYRDYLVDHLANGKRGSADLCAYFFLRGFALLDRVGDLSLLATNTIAQGDTREVGLDQLLASHYLGKTWPALQANGKGTVVRAVPSRKWPGDANLEVAHLWLRRGDWQGEYMLDDKPVPGITAFLTRPGTVEGTPYRLVAHEGKSFIGSYVLGMGFVLEQEEAETWIARDPRNREVLFPYINGEDLNSRPDQSPSRWVINFRDWPLERAETYPDCIAIVRERAKPERDRLATGDATARDRARRWWQFARSTMNLYATIAGMDRVLVRARVANINSIAFAPSGIIASEQTVIFASSAFWFFVLLQAFAHTEWLHYYASSMQTDVRYTPSDCFENFPFPATTSGLNTIGERYYTHRQSIMLARQEGLTKTYNRFHNPDEHAEDIAIMRALHVEMDQAVAAAYGWTDLDLGHGFHVTKQGLRYTISESARREVLGRLLALNHARYAEEVAQGLHDRGVKKASKGAADSKRGKISAKMEPLFEI